MSFIPLSLEFFELVLSFSTIASFDFISVMVFLILLSLTSNAVFPVTYMDISALTFMSYWFKYLLKPMVSL